LDETCAGVVKGGGVALNGLGITHTSGDEGGGLCYFFGELGGEEGELGLGECGDVDGHFGNMRF
jgi:hypothetical protein